MSRLNTRQRIVILPWQTPGLLQRAGLTEQQVLENAWFLGADGQLYRGAHAISEALAVMQPVLRLARWLYAIPCLRRFADWAYRWVADNRYRLPGSTAACAVPPRQDTNT